MEIQVVIGVVVVISLALLRLFAARRAASGQRQFIWLVFAPTLFIGIAVLWVSVQVFDRAPLVGLLIAVIAVIHLWLLVRLIRGMSMSLTSSRPDGEVTTAMTDPLADYMGVMTSLMLIVAVIGLVGLIVWGVVQAAS